MSPPPSTSSPSPAGPAASASNAPANSSSSSPPPQTAAYVERFLGLEHPPLTNPSLETLAIIAYRQPITRTGIEAVRGVDCDGPIRTLMARGLVEEVGRSPVVGRPVLFGTTVRFLEYFGLEKPDDLPPLPFLEEEPQELPEEATI